jgi:EAL domain-containing protein (putative c-di-GMP-specific phosphodiesterase class I)
MCTEAKVIVEGIETAQEFPFLCDLGMRYAQGFYLAKPSIAPTKAYPLFELA